MPAKPDTYKPTISPSALAALSTAVTYADGPPRVKLTCGALGDLYPEVNEVLMRLGGKWKGAKLSAHVFESDPTADLAAVVASGMMPPKNPLAFFPTPPDLARMLVDHSDMVPLWVDAVDGGTTLTILEPSAGRGALIDAALALLGISANQARPSLRILAVELDPRHAAYLRAKYAGGDVEVSEGDFLTWSAPEGEIALIVMNPPFAAEKDSLAYITHILRAWEMLTPGGQMLAITPSSWPTRQDRRCREFAEFVEAHGQHWENEAEAFKASGTGVSTRTILLQKPGGF